MPDFAPPNLLAPLDVEEHIRAAPESGRVKGMYVQRLVEMIDEHRGEPSSKRYIAFKDYPLRELMRQIARAAELLHPRLPLRHAILVLGREVFPTLQSSLALRVLFSFAGRSYESALQRVADGYSYSQHPGTARLASIRPGEAIVELREVYNFADCYQIGVHEGALAWYEHSGSIEIRVHSIANVDLRIRWS